MRSGTNRRRRRRLICANVHTTLIDAATLHDHLGDSRWVIVDCRHTLADFSLGRRLYDEAHIPGAFFADVERDLSGSKNGRNGRHPLPDPHEFAEYLRSIGVSDDSQVVAYDAGADMFAARFWFLCRWIGHAAVAVLDGGMAAWTAAGYALTDAVPSAATRGALHVRLNDALVVDAGFVHTNLQSNNGALILDARAADRFAGENETVDPVSGHVPGARNHPFKQNFSADGRFLPIDQLRAAFAAHGDAKRIVHQCGSGVSAAVNALAMEHAGLGGSRLYAGSWSEWIVDPSRPIAVGPA